DERRGFFAIRHFDAAIGDHRHTEVFGVNLVFADYAVLEFAHHGGCAQGPFVHAVFAVHDQNVTGAEALKHTHLNADQVGVEDAHELIGSTGGVGERAQNVEDRANAELLAHCGHVFHGAVVGGREHEADAHRFDAFGDLFGAHVDVDAQGLEHVCAARRRGGAAVAVFGDLHPRRRRNEHGRGRNVEGVGAVAARAAHVEQAGGIGHRHGHRELTHDLGSGGYLANRLLL